MPMGHETNRALCHNFAAHDGCPRATCPYVHTLPTDPLSTLPHIWVCCPVAAAGSGTQHELSLKTCQR